jgi:hypothetical protein
MDIRNATVLITGEAADLAWRWQGAGPFRGGSGARCASPGRTRPGRRTYSR